MQPKLSLAELANNPNPTMKRRPYFDRSPITNQKLYSFANKEIRKEAVQAVHEIEMTEKGDLGRKFFYLDHTAEVLENYRRIQENIIFDKVIHEGRQKKAFLKNESRKLENLILNPSFDLNCKGLVETNRYNFFDY